MATSSLSFSASSTELLKEGVVVGITDRIYRVDGNEVTFNEVLLKGDLSGELHYNGVKLVVIKVDTAVGMLVDEKGARGPVWKGVVCRKSGT